METYDNVISYKTIPDGASPSALGNIQFLGALAQSLTALIISAAFLMAGYAIFSPELTAYREAATKLTIQSRNLNGSDLTVRLGAGKKTHEAALHLTELSQDDRAIVTSKTNLQANDYPFIEYRLNNFHPGEVVYLIWRTAENPEDIARARLHWTGDKATYNVARHKEWQGRITELGFDIYGELREKPLIISSLKTLPYSTGAALASIWSDWTALEVWDQTSTNYLRGTPKGAILPPTVAMAAWGGLALLLLNLFSLLKRTHQPISYIAIVLIPWLALDFLWQARLNAQLTETKYLFQGKSQQDRHLADVDSDLYRYSQHLKNEVLPENTARIFLLHDNKGQRHNYRRLRTQFHLLPNNVYNYGRVPPHRHTRNGDYILLLGAIDKLSFDPAGSQLSWGESKYLDVELIDHHPVGDLYRIRERENQ
jgi:hypothetical protein